MTPFSARRGTSPDYAQSLVSQLELRLLRATNAGLGIGRDPSRTLHGCAGTARTGVIVVVNTEDARNHARILGIRVCEPVRSGSAGRTTDRFGGRAR